MDTINWMSLLLWVLMSVLIAMVAVRSVKKDQEETEDTILHLRGKLDRVIEIAESAFALAQKNCDHEFEGRQYLTHLLRERYHVKKCSICGLTEDISEAEYVILKKKKAEVEVEVKRSELDALQKKLREEG